MGKRSTSARRANSGLVQYNSVNRRDAAAGTNDLCLRDELSLLRDAMIVHPEVHSRCHPIGDC